MSDVSSAVVAASQIWTAMVSVREMAVVNKKKTFNNLRWGALCPDLLVFAKFWSHNRTLEENRSTQLQLFGTEQKGKRYPA